MIAAAAPEAAVLPVKINRIGGAAGAIVKAHAVTHAL